MRVGKESALTFQFCYPLFHLYRGWGEHDLSGCRSEGECHCHRRRIKTEDKLKVVAAVLGNSIYSRFKDKDEFIHILQNRPSEKFQAQQGIE